MEYMSRSVQRLGGLPRGTKRFLMVAHDFFALTLAAALLPWLLGAPARTLLVNPDHLLFFAIYVPGGLVILWRLHFYRMVLRRLDQSVVQQIVWAGLALSGLAAAIYLERTIPVKAVVLGLVIGGLSVVLLGFGRALMRAALSDIAVGGGEGAPLIIYGAGRAGHHLAATLANDERFRPVAFLDDDPALQSLRVGALTVHPSKDIDALRRRFDVTRVALAIPSLGRRRRREITDRLNAAGFEVLSIPTFADLVSGSHAVSDLRKVDVDELLGRDVVDLSQSRLHRWFKGRTVLVTGAGGSIGAEVARQILQLGPARLILFDISEVALYEIDQELSAQADRTEIVPILGSVTDRARLDAVFAAQKIDAVFHAAAYKHVPLVEANTLAGIANNVIGTEEVAQAAGRAGVERFVLVSTDKAVRPTNVMGATKRLAELVVGAAQQRHGDTVYSMVRFGNVLGSSGSVIPLFERQIMQGGPVTVTHPDIIRYFMTIPEASQLVVTAGLQAKGGEVFVLDMGAPVKIIDLARRMIRLSGATVRDGQTPDGDIEIRITGLRPGEKLYEELLTGDGVAPTPDPKIFCARESTLAADHTARLVSRLRAACLVNDTDAALSALSEAVPDYRPSPQAADCAVSAKVEPTPATGVPSPRGG